MSSSINLHSTDHAVFIWSPLGGGHKTAKEALQEQIQTEYAACGQYIDTTTYDINFITLINSISIPFFGNLGDFATKTWNDAQKLGNLTRLKQGAKYGWIPELILYPFVYAHVRSILEKMESEPKHIICTQAFCLNAIAKAVLAINHQKGWNTKVDVYITDIPSKDAIHFLPSIKKAISAGPAVKEIIRIHAPQPLTNKNEIDFWQEHCGTTDVITDSQYPIRKAFLQTEHLKQELEKETIPFNIRMNHKKSEKKILKNGIQNLIQVRFTDEAVTIPIHKQDKVAFIMLGSQPTQESILNWVEQFIEAQHAAVNNANTHATTKNTYIFVYCGPATSPQNQNTLLEEVDRYIDQLRDDNKLPQNCNIIPFSQQPPEFVALALARADWTVTRTGGATTMELHNLFKSGVVQREKKTTILHSEALQYNLTLMQQKNRLRKIKEMISLPKSFKLSSTEITKIEIECVSLLRDHGYTQEKSIETTQTLIQSILSDKNKSREERLYKFNKTFDALIELSRIQFNSKQETEIQSYVQALLKKPKHQNKTEEEIYQLAIQKLQLNEGMFLWEAKNAKCLINKIGAIVSNPELAQQKIIDTLSY